MRYLGFTIEYIAVGRCWSASIETASGVVTIEDDDPEGDGIHRKIEEYWSEDAMAARGEAA